MNRLEPCPFCGVLPIPESGKVLYDLHHKPMCFLGGRITFGASELGRWNTRALERENQQLRAKVGEFETYIITAQVAEAKAVKGWEECSDAIEQLRDGLRVCKEALEYIGSHEHDGFDESNSHYNKTCSVCKKIDTALAHPSLQALKEPNANA